MRNRFAALVLLAFLAAAPIARAADKRTTLDVEVPDRGTIQVPVDSSWKTVILADKSGLPPTAIIDSANGAFRLMITVLWSNKPDPNFADAKQIRGIVESGQAHLETTSVEKKLAIHQIRGPEIRGLWFWATEHEPEKGRYLYRAQGAASIGKLVVTFAVLAKNKPPASLEVPLASVKNLKLVDVPKTEKK